MLIFNEFLILPNENINNAMKIMDKVSSKTLFVYENEMLLGSLSDGDIRRAILKGVDLTESIDLIMNFNPTFFYENYQISEIKKVMLEKRFEAIPIVTDQMKIIDILFWNNVFYEKGKKYKLIDLPVIIMAGGKGTRLAPFTNILPKPLIPIGDKPIIEIIMDEYTKFGINKFYISLNYKAKLIKAYFEDSVNDYKIKYIDENKPLGTAGSIKLLEGIVKTTFFVSNCDIIIKDDYSKILEFHTKNNFDLTLVASMQHHTIPYGVCEIEKGGELKEIKEKPQFDFLINTGMYILNPSVFEFIPKDTFYNMTDLIYTLKNNNKKVGVFPVSEKSWIDIGQWEEYKKTIVNFE